VVSDLGGLTNEQGQALLLETIVANNGSTDTTAELA
jgi:hypothetical protein